ncbi:MAG: ribosome small subunit-dependent GTPase A [candidate division Zixibacteria bacterium]|nr:ribosome small subunit-dependent GTPase A [candidate division Zixibacteria bacterium]MDH3937258.1 ribosome small subunit-dependent GTPase A [candidate division Zixibacteria bacterium]MDH4033884.1 ribosome small subunit-dependent GTPase A [candidate division Zixibacteria bacterium]
MDLHTLGFDDFFESRFLDFREQGYTPARVTQEHRERYQLFSEKGEIAAQLSGRFRHQAATLADYPTVGDWVAIDHRDLSSDSVIHGLVPRRTSFSRKAVLAGGPKYRAGRTDEQVLAANVDSVLLVAGLDNDFNVRRIERYLTIAWDSGAQPVIVLNKADLCDDPEAAVDQVEAVAAGVPVHSVSAVSGLGIETLSDYLKTGHTLAFLGSSGVGKSSLINQLLGESKLATGGVRKGDGRGRHTTTQRELIILPSGGLVIDTPGLREIQQFNDEGGLSRTFGDIETLMDQCRFNDCGHDTEPGCAVRAALESGSLDPKRYQSYLKMLKEQVHLTKRRDVHSRRQMEREFGQRVRRYHQDMKELKKKGLA